MVYHDLGLERNSTGEERIIPPVFKLYSREVSNSTVQDWLMTFVCEIKCAHKNASMLKNTL